MAAEAATLVMNHAHVPQPHPFFNVARNGDEEAISNAAIPVCDGSSDGRSRETQNLRKVARRRDAPTDAQRGLMAKFTGKTEPPDAQQTEPFASTEAALPEPALDADLNVDRRKRRKTDSTSPNNLIHETQKRESANQSTDSTSWRRQLEREATQCHREDRLDVPGTSPLQQHDAEQVASTNVEVVISSSPMTPSRARQVATVIHSSGKATPSTESISAKSPPRKMLRLNALGTLGSPRAKRAKKTATHGSAEVRLVRICYGTDDASRRRVGHRIDGILSGERPHQSAMPTLLQPLRSSQNAQASLKPKHPLFMSKAEKQAADSAKGETLAAPATKQASPRKAATATPGKLRTSLASNFRHVVEDAPSKPLFGDLRSAGLERFQGSVDAAWPWSGVAHVRGISDLPTRMSTARKERRAAPDMTKRKHLPPGVDRAEDVVHLVWRRMQTDPQLEANTQWLPRRLLANGEDIQAMVHNQLHTSLETAKADRWLRKLFSTIHTTMTPFDLGRYEQQAWVNKYAPQSADAVLQTGNEALALRDWLRRLTVTAAESSLRSNEKVTQKSKRRLKRRRRNSDLDDFIVDEDTTSLDELTDPEAGDLLPPERRSMLRTISTAAGGKLANVVLLSGPHGSGKTAAVYAVAKELDFEVFEINAGTRRSGKDIMDRVGDMTENHLVRQHIAHENQTGDESEDGIMEAQLDGAQDRTKEDIDSGRQSTMASFFKSTKKVKPKTVTQSKSGPTPKSTKQGSKSGHSLQRQSLILLEEVDVLFEEDQGFWSTVRALATHSKRPIIMTCNDEHLVNIEEDSLHAILRFKHPPLDLATDYLLLVAACEGHVLHREAVHSLLESRGGDLRGSVSELNFWCQMAVGDVKGGLEWMYPRWPPETDKDEQGRRIRVASKDTYRAGMGWLGEDAFLESHSHLQPSDALLHEAFNFWDIKPDFWSPTGPSVIATVAASEVDPIDKPPFAALIMAEEQADTLSAIDCVTGLHSTTPELDASAPDLHAKSRSSFVDGYQLLDAQPAVHHDDLRVGIASQAALLSTNVCSREAADPATPVSAAIARMLAHWRHQALVPGTTSLAIRSALEPLTATHTSSLGFGAPTNAVPTLTSLDRPISLLTTDIAPFVRGIAAYDLRLEAQRLRLSSLLSERSGAERRMRKTRAARSALEGGRRETTRRERWFRGAADLNLQLVLETGGRHFAGIGAASAEGSANGDGTDSLTGALSTFDGALEDIKSSQSSL